MVENYIHKKYKDYILNRNQLLDKYFEYSNKKRKYYSEFEYKASIENFLSDYEKNTINKGLISINSFDYDGNIFTHDVFKSSFYCFKNKCYLLEIPKEATLISVNKHYSDAIYSVGDYVYIPKLIYIDSKGETKTFKMKIKEIHLFLDTCIIVTECNEKIAIKDLEKW
jgi:hypothetical protein